MQHSVATVAADAEAVADVPMLFILLVLLCLSDLTRIIVDSGCLPLSSLVIVPDRQVWQISIDVVIMSIAGNLIDAIMLAVKAALVTTTSVMFNSSAVLAASLPPLNCIN